jgi:hypothetical protein
MLTPEGFTNLERLVERARQGDLGDDVNDAAFYFSFKGLTSEGAVRFEIVRKDGARAAVTLLRPPVPRMEATPHYFVLFPDDDVPASRVERLGVVLDDAARQIPGRTTGAGRGRRRPGRGRVLLGAFFVAARLPPACSLSSLRYAGTETAESGRRWIA